MPSFPAKILPRRHRFRAFFSYIYHHLNFFRVHLLVLCVIFPMTGSNTNSQYSTFTPLIFSAILYASNGENKISYIDALFNSVSAMEVCGLATVDLSLMTNWQQGILFIQMCIGSPVSTSLLFLISARWTYNYDVVYPFPVPVLPS